MGLKWNSYYKCFEGSASVIAGWVCGQGLTEGALREGGRGAQDFTWGVVGVSGGAQGFTWGGDNSRWSSRALTSHLPHHGVNAVFYRWASLGLFLHSSFCYLDTVPWYTLQDPLILPLIDRNMWTHSPPDFIMGHLSEIFDKKWVKCAIRTLIYKSLVTNRPHPPTFGSIVPNLPVFYGFPFWLTFLLRYD